VADGVPGVMREPVSSFRAGDGWSCKTELMCNSCVRTGSCDNASRKLAPTIPGPLQRSRGRLILPGGRTER
jgi:hypothetical protein